jgi:AraC-like DNA-binding protein
MARQAAQFRIVTDFPAAPLEASDALQRALGGLRLTQASAALYDCSPAWRIVRRRQRHDMLLLPITGRGRVAVDGRWFAIAPRRLVYAARGSWLQAECDPAAPLRVVVLAHRADVTSGVPFAVAAGLPSAIQLRDEDGVDTSLLSACREDALRQPGWQAAMNAHVLGALVALARRAGARCMPPTTTAAGALARISPALAVMSQDLSQPLRIAELALACDLGQVQFRRLFHAAMSMPPIAHLQRLRLAEAQRLIAGGLLVREAADAVGYRSAACLDRVFRRLAGTTPGRWRAGMSR